jgi:hypothetical protein
MIQEWKVGDTGVVTIDPSEQVVILFDKNSIYKEIHPDGTKITFYHWHNGSEGLDQMIFIWGYDGYLVDRIHYVWKQVLNSIDSHKE